ncbi:flavodoxin reductase family protein [Mycolicibacterium phlei]|jgi:ferredoxin-NADP reductase|uniref:Ferredoxin n=2 Tax=Mycolicibacterium phlei TaxID=1771 RepID=A0A5N5UU50_MYCPH|nr:PDR/VanB family oxidoreductase [Mycolicibacterium phlei]VEG09257.1 flavodoxin reductase family protein [Mycobacteroides chelonae]AMO61142.1 Phenoxybenzoate dioxygenase subunit beta [Mycolicibacterium phlei]EID08892.1 flavodoxin reductase family protein [Mycolicibacterium phlei RIVM601174]KAB7752607.1 ferredoxin [Mycolicibacterium phlei DSM 43239 = CCUG 21000]KXW60959.1 ferredoxin [Mycolicibacterium phlei DSM 43239 = CCUG 21000]
MALGDRYRGLPINPFGRGRHHLMIGLAAAVYSSMETVHGLIRKVAPPPERDRTLPLRVAARQVVAHDENVVALTLTAADGGRLPRWYPGSHIDITLPSGRVRQYSLCGDPAEAGSYRIAVRRIPDGGGGSVEVHDALPVGATVTTHGPRNAFPLTVPGYGSPTQRLRFIAGGIGITPILPMLGLADRLGVQWSMIYTGRSRDSLPFLDEVARFGDAVRIRTDDVAGLPDADELLGDCPDGTAVYACGPAPMLTALGARLADRTGVELHFERFAAPPVVDGAPFAVTVASTGQTVEVGADETLLAALTRAGVPVRYSCQQGFCGTCRTRVLDGAVDHRDLLLTDPERAAGQMLVCISRAAGGGPLTLDL